MKESMLQLQVNWPLKICCLCALLAAGCLPQDPEGTLERVAGGTLRVGVSESPPWTTKVGEDAPSGIEPQLVLKLADELDAEVSWHPNTEDVLFHQLEHFELDLVVCGLKADTPWKDRVALTLPYWVVATAQGREEHVLAVPPGENAWLLRVEQFLHREEGLVEQLWREAQ